MFKWLRRGKLKGNEPYGHQLILVDEVSWKSLVCELERIHREYGIYISFTQCVTFHDNAIDVSARVYFGDLIDSFESTSVESLMKVLPSIEMLLKQKKEERRIRDGLVRMSRG